MLLTWGCGENVFSVHYKNKRTKNSRGKQKHGINNQDRQCWLVVPTNVHWFCSCSLQRHWASEEFGFFNSSRGEAWLVQANYGNPILLPSDSSWQEHVTEFWHVSCERKSVAQLLLLPFFILLFAFGSYTAMDAWVYSCLCFRVYFLGYLRNHMKYWGGPYVRQAL